MAGPLLSRRKIVGATEETTSGTAATVTAALGDNFYDASCDPENLFSEGPRTPQGHYLGGVDAVLGQKVGRMRFTQEIRAGGAFLPFLTGAGYLLGSGTYKPTSVMGSRKTWSLGLFEDGLKKLLFGAAGNCSLAIREAQRVTAAWDWMGVFSAVTDVSLPPRAPITTAPYVARSVTLTIGGSAIPLHNEISIDLGARVTPREDIAVAAGVSHFYISEFEPRVTIDCEAALVATLDQYGLLVAGTTAALSIVLTSGATTLTIAAPRVQRLEVATGDRGGKMTNPITLACLNSSGDDALNFTEA